MTAQADRALARRTLVLCALVSLLDGYDLVAAALTIPGMAKSWGAEPASFGIAMSATSLAMAISAAILGPLGDRLGRRPLIIASFALAGLGCLGVPFADSVAELTALRFLTGIGLGASLTHALALAAEFSREETRSRTVTAVYCMSGIGGMSGGLLAPWILPLAGWQGIYFVGGIVSLLVCVVLLVALPEAPSLSLERRPAASKSASPAELGRLLASLLDERYRATTVIVWLLFFVSSFCTYLVSSWLPTLMNISGRTVSESALAMAAFSLGGVLAGFPMAWFVDRGHARVALMLANVVTAGALAAISGAPASLVLLLALVLCTGPALTGVMYVLPGIIVRTYPASLSSSGIGAAGAIGRLGSIIAPLGGSALLLLDLEVRQIFLAMIAPLGVGFLLSLFVRFRRA